jgi:hypothetical protein
MRLKLNNEEIYSLYISQNIIRVKKSRKMMCVMHIVRMCGIRSGYKSFVGKPEGKRQLLRYMRWW